jgi:hypothetical protein
MTEEQKKYEKMMAEGESLGQLAPANDPGAHPSKPQRASADKVELIKAAIADITPDTATELRDRLIKEVIKARVDPEVRKQLIKLMAKRRGVSVADLEPLWGQIERKVAAEERLTPEQQAAENERLRNEYEAMRELRIAAHKGARDALYAKIRHIAERPTLLRDLINVVHRLGVISERRAIVSIYLTATSRLHKRRAMSLLRRGAAAAGKNHLIETVFRLFPRESIVEANGGSPKSLIYMGGADDQDALMHKIVYVPEAASIEDRGGVENEFTTLLRSLISENRISHPVAQVPEGGGSPVTTVITKHGPIAVVVTSARDNIEDEMLTRLMISDADESAAQTRAIISNVLSEHSAVPEAELEALVGFQVWLEMGGPYEVAIPFLAAIDAAIGQMPKAPLRIRRDIDSFVRAIMASAIVHSAQRQRDDADRIVADLADYSAAYEAFNPDMSALYAQAIPATAKAVIEAIEELIVEERSRGAPNADDAKVTYDTLRTKLGISSNDTAGNRLRDAVRRGLIERTNPEAPQRAASRYRVLVRSVDLESNKASEGVFPTPDAVRSAFAGAASKNADTPQKRGQEGVKTNGVDGVGGVDAAKSTPSTPPEITPLPLLSGRVPGDGLAAAHNKKDRPRSFEL